MFSPGMNLIQNRATPSRLIEVAARSENVVALSSSASGSKHSAGSVQELGSSPKVNSTTFL